VNFAYMLVSCKRHISIVGERETTAREREGRPPGWGASGGGEISYCEENFSKRDANKRERERLIQSSECIYFARVCTVEHTNRT
jgi:hypothetical protein